MPSSNSLLVSCGSLARVAFADRQRVEVAVTERLEDPARHVEAAPVLVVRKLAPIPCVPLPELTPGEDSAPIGWRLEVFGEPTHRFTHQHTVVEDQVDDLRAQFLDSKVHVESFIDCKYRLLRKSPCSC